MIKKIIVKEKIIAVIREKTFEEALEKSRLIAKCGIHVIEVTYTTPNAGKVIKIIKKEFPDKLVGSGSVVTLKDAKNSIENNVDFIVSPGFSQEVSDECKKFNILYIPGSITPSEFIKAYSEGWSLVKLFPLTFLTQDYVKSISNAMPYLKFMGTGGVSNDNIASWMEIGVSSFGLGSSLTSGTMEDIKLKIKELKEIINA